MRRMWMSFKIVFLGVTVSVLFGFSPAGPGPQKTCAQLPALCKTMPPGSDKCFCHSGEGCLIVNGSSGCGKCYDPPGDEGGGSDPAGGPDN